VSENLEYEREVLSTPETEKPPQRRRALTCLIIAAAVVLLLVCLAAVGVLIAYLTGGELPIALPFLGRAGDEVLLAFLDHDEAELYMLELGQSEEEAALLAEDAERVPAIHWLRLLDEGRYRGLIIGEYGSFLPDSDRLLLWYGEEDETVIQQMRVRDEEPTEVLESGADTWSGTFIKDSGNLFLREFRDEGVRCYVARPGEEAERLAKADECFVSADGSTVVFEEVDDGEMTLSAVDIDGENETVLLDGVEGVASYRFSGDGSHFAYVQKESGSSQLYLLERSSGDESEVSGEVFDLVSYDFAFGSDSLFYITEEIEDDRGVLRLYLSSDAEPIAEGPALAASFAPDGQHLAYLLEDEEGESALYVHPMDGGGDVEVLEGDEIDYTILETSPPRIIALSEMEEEFTLYSADIAGGDVIELLDEEDVSLEIEYARGERLLYVQMTNEDGEVSLFVTPVDEAAGSLLLEEWAAVRVLNLSPRGDRLILWAREDFGDDPVLYSIAVGGDEGDLVELDDDGENFDNAVFSADGRSVIYTAATGDDIDEVEVRRARVDGEEDYETLYEEAYLVDVRWDAAVLYSPLLHWEVVERAQFARANRVAFVSDRDGNEEIYVMDVPSGADAEVSESVRLTDNSIEDRAPILSPDGQRVAFVSGSYDNGEVYVVNVDGSGLLNLSDDEADDDSPTWSPDGQRILFVSDREGNNEIYSINPDGSGLVNLTESSDDDYSPVWTPDGQRILFRSDRDNYNAEIYLMDADGSNMVRLTDNEGHEFLTPHGLWSPDGRYIAFAYDHDGSFETIDVYLMDAGCMDRPEECEDSLVQLTEEQGWCFAGGWSPDGSKILIDIDLDGGDSEESWEVYVMDVDEQEATQLTESGGERSWSAGWLADEDRILFLSGRDGDDDIYLMDSDGDNVVNLTDNSADDYSPDLWP